MILEGAHLLSLDAKGRMTVPLRVRERLAAQSAGKVVVTADYMGFLLLFPEPLWGAFYEAALALPRSAELARNTILSNAEALEVDAGGRLQLSANLRTEAGLDKDVRLAWNVSRYEIWDTAVWRSRQELARLATPAADIESIRA
jgi:MraZ protein